MEICEHNAFNQLISNMHANFATTILDILYDDGIINFEDPSILDYSGIATGFRKVGSFTLSEFGSGFSESESKR